jgi:hypothetical protein
MSVTEVHEALGEFEFEFLGSVPREILDTIQYFGHVAFIPARLDPKQYGDNTLAAARYVGVVRRIKIADDGRTNLIEDDIQVSGVSMEFWLGDEDGKGPVIETETLFDTDTFSTVITDLCPTALQIGTIHTVAGSYSGRHQYETPRSAIQYVCETISSSAAPVGYRVTNTGKLNAGYESDLFVTNPTCIIIKKGISQGEDMTLRALQTTVDLDQDMEDFTTRVVMIAEESEEQLATGSADIATVSPGTNIFKDLYGNPLKLTRLVSESDTIDSNADTRAEVALRTYLDPHRQLTLAADDYDVHGSFETGDYVWVYDPDTNLVDTANEIYVRGLRINPIKLRVTQTNWPVTEGYTVAFRDANGVWTDLSDYIHWEEDQPSQITIGDFERNLTDSGESVSARVSSFVQPDTSIPAAPTWTTGSFTTSNYLDGNGFSTAAITVVWSVPINQDSSVITDGDHYEVNYRVQGQTDWSILNVAWGTNSLRVGGLAVATNYEFRVRGIDKSNNLGTFSSTTTVLSSEDTTAPSTPAAPTVAASTIAIQVTHTLGKSSGGTYNLEADLAALEVHQGTSSGFTASSGTYVGSMRANQGMMDAQVPAVETFQVSSTSAVFFKVIAVDTSGNKSAASTAATTTALLVDDAHISNLTVTKILAGTISTNWLLGANIQTAASGQRVALNSTGLHGYDSGGNEVVTVSSSGSFSLRTANSGNRMEMDSTGLKTYDSNGDLSSYLASDPSASGDYLSFRDSSGAILAAVTSTGVGSFTSVYADTGLYIDGMEIRDLLDQRPRGIIAMSLMSTTSDTTSGAGSGGEKIWNRIKIPDYDITRQYKICYMVNLDVALTAPTYVGTEARYDWDTPPTSSSTQLFSQQWGGRSTSATDANVSGNHAFSFSTAGGTDLHIGFFVFASLAGVSAGGVNFARVWVEDIGPAFDYDNFDPTATGGSGANPGQSYTKSYNTTWTGRYNGSGSLLNANNDVYQGQYDSNNGNQKSMLGFNFSAIQSDLSGATVTGVTLTLTNKHWYNNAGGTAVIGTHNSSASSAPGTFASTSLDLAEFSEWPLGATWAVTLDPVDFGTPLKNNTIKGLVLGPGAGGSTSHEYYGYFAGQNSTSSKPKLTITYKK